MRVSFVKSVGGCNTNKRLIDNKLNSCKSSNYVSSASSKNIYSPNFYRPICPPRKSLSFRGTPLKAPKQYIKGCYEAVQAYDYLRFASYLDTNDDFISPSNKLIREANFSFLDELQGEGNKKLFIEHFKKVTGFPNLTRVSERIESEFVDTIKNSSQKLGGGKYNCIAAGYDPTCSVGLKVAFPASDIDKGFIILKGADNDAENIDIVNKFGEQLWHKTDQRVLSYNHNISFPNIVTEKQLLEQLKEVNKRTYHLNFDAQKMKALREEGHLDVDSSAKYNLKIAECFNLPDDTRGTLEPDRRTVKNLAYVVEAIRDGKKVIEGDGFKALQRQMEKYDFYNFSNIGKIRAIKNARKAGIEDKTKYTRRQELEKEFDTWSVPKQYDLVKSIIRYASEDNTGFDEYFKSDRNLRDHYKPMLNRLVKGDIDIYHLPKFAALPDGGLRMEYGKENAVKLYQGEAPNILWVDSSSPKDTKAVLSEIDRIKAHKKFKDVTRLQLTQPISYDNRFKFCNKKAANGSWIYEIEVK